MNWRMLVGWSMAPSKNSLFCSKNWDVAGNLASSIKLGDTMLPAPAVLSVSR